MAASDYASIHEVLRSGVTGTTGTGLMRRVTLAPEQVDDLVSRISAAAGSRDVMLVDEDEHPIAMMRWPSRVNALRFVIDPRELGRAKAKDPLRSSHVDDAGVLQVEYGRTAEQLPPLLTRHVQGEPEAPTAVVRLVTTDASVHLAGLRAELFEPSDRLVVSAASQLDFVGSRKVSYDEDGRVAVRLTPGPHHASALLPIDGAVLRSFTLYYEVWLAADEDARAQLSMSDLLCAATSRECELPLYTTKPTAYRFLKHGLKTIKYGPVRNPDILAAPDHANSQDLPED